MINVNKVNFKQMKKILINFLQCLVYLFTRFSFSFLIVCLKIIIIVNVLFCSYIYVYVWWKFVIVARLNKLWIHCVCVYKLLSTIEDEQNGPAVISVLHGHIDALNVRLNEQICTTQNKYQMYMYCTFVYIYLTW